MESLLVIVVAYQSQDTIGPCLTSIAASCHDAHAVVVNNSRDRETRTKVEQVSADTGLLVEYVDPGANLGYSRAVNLALSIQQNSDLVLVLNPDATVTEDPRVLAPRLDSCRIVSGVLVTPPHLEPKRVPNARPRVTLLRELLRSLLGSRVYRGPRRTGEGEYVVDQIDGSYMLFRRAWIEARGFDERFELYYEDVAICDLARRESGCLVVNRVVGTHAGGASAKKSGATAYRVHRVSRARYLKLRYGHIPDWVLKAVFVVEFAVRSSTGQHEASSVRRRALQEACTEIRAPMSVRVLT
jgi:GT2 family glycosyltransferase